MISGVAFGLAALEALHRADLVPSLVIGYSSNLAHRSGYADVCEAASHYGLAAHRTNNINDPRLWGCIRTMKIDLGVVCGWSQLIKRPLLDAFPLGLFGLHPTRLPQGRGRAPIPWTLINDLRSSAVSLFRLDEGADSGPLVDQHPFDISDSDDASTLYSRISAIQAQLLVDNLPRLLNGQVELKEQTGEASYWARRTDDDGEIHWDWPTRRLFNWIRALTHPYPGAWTSLEGRRLRIWAAQIQEGRYSTRQLSGTVMPESWRAASPALMVASGAKDLAVVLSAQFDGESLLIGEDLLSHHLIRPGARLGA